jgi:hypothetical protein
MKMTERLEITFDCAEGGYTFAMARMVQRGAGGFLLYIDMWLPGETPPRYDFVDVVKNWRAPEIYPTFQEAKDAALNHIERFFERHDGTRRCADQAARFGDPRP